MAQWDSIWRNPSTGFIMMCAWEDNLTVSLSSQVYKWVTVNLMIGGIPWGVDILLVATKSEANHRPVSWFRSSCFHSSARSLYREGTMFNALFMIMFGKEGWLPRQHFPILKWNYVIFFFQSIFKAIKSDKSDSEQWPLHKLTLYVGVPAEKATKGVDTR